MVMLQLTMWLFLNLFDIHNGFDRLRSMVKRKLCFAFCLDIPLHIKVGVCSFSIIPEVIFEAVL